MTTLNILFTRAAYLVAFTLDRIYMSLAKLLPIPDAYISYTTGRGLRFDAWGTEQACTVRAGGFEVEIDR